MPPIKKYGYGERVIVNGQDVGSAKYDAETGLPLTVPSTTPAPVAPTGQSLTYQESPSDKALREATESAASYYKTQSGMVVDEAQIRQDALAQMQAEIDATNKIYADKLQRAQVQGTGRLGTSGAINARRGLAGSDFGNAQTNQVEDANSQIYSSIDQEKNAAISALLTKAKESGTAAIAEKRAAKEKGIEEYLKNLSSRGETAKARASELAKQILISKLGIEQYDPTSLETAATSAGVSVDEIKRQYGELKAAQDAQEAEAQIKARRENVELGKLETETRLLQDKFEEDKRRFGLEYAIKQQELGLKQAEFGLKQSESAKATGSSTMTPDQKAFLNSSLNKVEELKGASGRGSISRALGGAISGDNDFNRLSKNVDAVKVNVLTLMADPNVKKFFGPQMSNADVQLMASIGTSLDPVSSSPADIQDEVTRIRDIVNRANKAVEEGLGATQSGGQKVTAPDGQEVIIVD